MTPTLTATEARDHLPEALNQVAYGGRRFIIKRRGKVLAALVSESDLAILESLEDKHWGKEAKAALARAKKRKETAIPWEKARKELGL